MKKRKSERKIIFLLIIILLIGIALFINEKTNFISKN